MWSVVINVDISGVWGALSLPDLLGIEQEVARSHAMLAEGTGADAEVREWMKLPRRELNEEGQRILKTARAIRSSSDVCVVVGIGGCCAGSRAAIALLQGPNRNIGKGKGDPQIFFAGNNLSTRHWNELMGLLEGKDFSLIVLSGSGDELEPAIAFRGLRWMLERRYGTDEAAKRICAVAAPECGALRQMASEEGWESFDLPACAEGQFSVLSSGGLLIMAVAGIDILQVLNGAVDAGEEYDLRSFENPAWLYAGVRNVLYRKGKAIEILGSFEPGFYSFGRWWQQLFGEAEGKDGKGLFPVAAELTEDLHSLGQMIQLGQRNLFETMVRFDGPEKEYTIGSDWKNLDGLNYLEGKTLDFVDRMAFEGTLAAHEAGGVPVITMDCGQLNDRKVGELFFFLELACVISAYTLGVDPFDRSGREACKNNMVQLLGKPTED